MPDTHNHLHRHLRLADGKYVWQEHSHEHDHADSMVDFNAVHHHAPLAHAGMTRTELTVREQVHGSYWAPPTEEPV